MSDSNRVPGATDMSIRAFRYYHRMPPVSHNNLYYCRDDCFYEASHNIKRGIQESNYTAIVDLCRSLSAELPSLHSHQENEWLTEYLFVTNSGYWAYKLGLFRETADAPWQWADGSQVDYTNWASPPDTYGNECVNNAAIGTDGQWYNNKEFCVPYDSAVCQKDPQ
ncbi:pulmonary surfactant-associated protein A-like isoform 1 [Aphelenchoides avenae]|nr:pulmonary surfactant-associated protein A-like isoform 1 [Aphelenchus avenae]